MTTKPQESQGSTTTPSIYARFVAAYEKIQNPKKDKQANYGTYATLEEVLSQVKPVLAEHDLALVQESISDENGVGVRTVIYDEHGNSIDFGGVTLPLDKRTAQAAGSCLTYARRYALKGIFGLAEVDDDGGGAARTEAENAEATTGWSAIVEAYKTHGTREAVMDFLGNPTTPKQAVDAYNALTRQKKGVLALIATGAQTA